MDLTKVGVDCEIALEGIIILLLLLKAISDSELILACSPQPGLLLPKLIKVDFFFAFFCQSSITKVLNNPFENIKQVLHKLLVSFVRDLFFSFCSDFFYPRISKLKGI
jgi:hypothetical protein